MRDKIILIRGWGNIASNITLGEYQRINADYLVLIAAMKQPETLPEEFCGFESDPTSMYHNGETILNNWALNEQEFIITSEYASMLTDRKEAKAVEGDALKVDWFYDTVKCFHRNLNQRIIEIEVVYDSGRERARVDGTMYLLEEVKEMFKPQPFLG